MSESVKTPQRNKFSSIKEGGLRMRSLPMRLFQKGNRLFWNPAEIDFSPDAVDWQNMTDDEREGTRILAASFLAGEEAVTEDIQPFMRAVAAEGRLEDEMFLTQFAFEEAKHVEGFRRWFDTVGVTNDLHSEIDDPGYRKIFYELLPEALNALHDDPSPRAQVRAAVIYNQVVEGVLAMTGYYAWRKAAKENDIMPGMQQLVALISRDERRHMAWGTFTCRRHIATDPDNWEVVQSTIDELLGPAMQLIEARFARYEDTGRPFPFGITKDDINDFAMNQFSRRLEVIEAAKDRTLAEVEGEDLTIEDELEEEAEAEISAA